MTRVLVGLTVLLLCLSSGLAHVCIHDQIEHTFDIHPEEDEIIMRSRNLAGSTPNWQPIRIHADFSGLKMSDSIKANFIKNKLIPAGLKFFAETLSVERLSTLKITQTTCHQLPVPSQYRTTGISGVDLVIFVTAENEGPNIMAWATYCQLGSDRRPIAGRINFNPIHVKTDADSWEEQISTMIHELTHVLAFSRSLYPHWRTWNGGLPTKDVYMRGKVRKLITTPRVAQVNKRYFGCSSLEGGELEDEGGAGSAGSHWERRIYGNEMLTASDVPDPRFSAFTFALLEDSGWYKADYSKAHSLEFGRDAGCSFHTEDCINKRTKKSRFPEFCDTAEKEACSFDRLFKGRCGSSYASYPLYDYMGDRTVGTDPYADECYTVSTFSYGDCRKTTGRYTSSYSLEAYGPKSRCFKSDISKYSYSSGIGNNIGCYNHECKVQDGQMRLFVQVGSSSVLCPLGGGKITTIPGYYGSIECPHEKYLCIPSLINPNFMVV